MGARIWVLCGCSLGGGPSATLARCTPCSSRAACGSGQEVATLRLAGKSGAQVALFAGHMPRFDVTCIQAYAVSGHVKRVARPFLQFIAQQTTRCAAINHHQPTQVHPPRFIRSVSALRCISYPLSARSRRSPGLLLVGPVSSQTAGDRFIRGLGRQRACRQKHDNANQATRRGTHISEQGDDDANFPSRIKDLAKHEHELTQRDACRIFSTSQHWSRAYGMDRRANKLACESIST